MTNHSFRLRLRALPALRLDLAGILPSDEELAAAELARRPVRHGNETLPLGEVFDIEAVADEGVPTLVLEGDLSRCDNVGRGMSAGRLRVEGDTGDYLGAQMRGGAIHVSGSAGMLAACEMAGGHLEVAGNVGDYAASALAGDMDGMRGGTLIVRGNAGARFADRMRRGTALVFGDAGDFLASRMVAGTIGLGGRPGAHCGFGMRRGTLVFAGEIAEPPATFVPTGHDIRVYWTLLARSLAKHGGAFSDLPGMRPRRLVGDVAVDGKGEWLLPD